ncbi:FecCD family ABC transporter permease [Cumulibacter soli]|uniref:FecCD family ABC transporter permease n=1 Tax=Cumulibacter soli TaxID=2546344 RepID=UPI001ABBDDC0|nr:iron chelate uptake ABC transporter family permease subunit [Cumulibacter soli]
MRNMPSDESLRAARGSAKIIRTRSVSLAATPRLIIVSAVLLAIMIILGIWAMTIGKLPISFADVFASLFGLEDIKYERVVHHIRLPRVVTAIFAGAALGASGAVFQSVSRNALGSPDVIGFTVGAATGAILQIVVFRAPAAQVALGAIIGGVVTALVVYLLSVKHGVSGGYRLILTGIGVGAICAAINDLLLVSGDLDDAVTANLWLSGSLDARTWEHAIPVMVGVVVLLPLISILARRATLMEMGDDLARQLGVPVERTRVFLMLAAVLLAALATAAAGPIAFVALAAPQIVARLTAARGMPVVSAALMGACLLVGADVIAQLLPISASVPIGRMTGIIGGVYLLYLISRSRQV